MCRNKFYGSVLSVTSDAFDGSTGWPSAAGEESSNAFDGSTGWQIEAGEKSD
jgi:hypothetical protein